MSTDLNGLRVFLVEDGFLIAEALVAHLEDKGCAIVGPFPTVRQASAAAVTAEVDGALLDVNVADGDSFPVAEILRGRGVPLIFLTGYGRGILPPAFEDVPCLTKPFELAVVARMVREHFGP